MSKACTCGNPDYGFDCVCEYVEKNPGNNVYTCEFCGLYIASQPICGRCEGEDDD